MIKRRDYGSAYNFWSVCGHGNVDMLRARESQPVVCFGVRSGMCTGIGLWIPPRSVAIWLSGGYLESRGSAAMVVPLESTLNFLGFRPSQNVSQQGF